MVLGISFRDCFILYTNISASYCQCHDIYSVEINFNNFNDFNIFKWKT